jgi:hypothetical protein
MRELLQRVLDKCGPGMYMPHELRSEIEAELAKPCDPVAYIHKDGKTLALPDDMWNPVEIGSNWTPLYTSPPEIEAELAKHEPEEWPCRMIAADWTEKTATIEFESSNFKAFMGKYKLVRVK